MKDQNQNVQLRKHQTDDCGSCLKSICRSEENNNSHNKNNTGSSDDSTDTSHCGNIGGKPSRSILRKRSEEIPCCSSTIPDDLIEVLDKSEKKLRFDPSIRIHIPLEAPEWWSPKSRKITITETMSADMDPAWFNRMKHCFTKKKTRQEEIMSALHPTLLEICEEVLREQDEMENMTDAGCFNCLRSLFGLQPDGRKRSEMSILPEDIPALAHSIATQLISEHYLYQSQEVDISDSTNARPLILNSTPSSVRRQKSNDDSEENIISTLSDAILRNYLEGTTLNHTISDDVETIEIDKDETETYYTASSPACSMDYNTPSENTPRDVIDNRLPLTPIVVIRNAIRPNAATYDDSDSEGERWCKVSTIDASHGFIWHGEM